MIDPLIRETLNTRISTGLGTLYIILIPIYLFMIFICAPVMPEGSLLLSFLISGLISFMAYQLRNSISIAKNFGIVFLSCHLCLMPALSMPEKSQEQHLSNTSHEAENTAVTKEIDIVKAVDLSHRVMDRPLSTYETAGEIENLPIDRKMNYQVVIPLPIQREQVEPIANQIIAKLTSEDSDIDEIILWLYSDKSFIDKQPYDLGVVTWAPQGKLGNVTSDIVINNTRKNYQLTVNLNDDLEEFQRLRNTKQVLYGLTEEKQVEIYRYAFAEFHKKGEAMHKAYEISDTKALQVENNFDKQLASNLRKKFGLSREQVDKICIEGLKRHWPLQ